MLTSDFSYELPEELIAQQPAAERDGSRLLCLERRTGVTSHHGFRDLPSLLRPGDRLVLNDTAVIPARVPCRKQTGGRVEVFFLRRLTDRRWEALVRPGRGVRAGSLVHPEGRPEDGLRVLEVLPDGNRVIDLSDKSLSQSIDEVLTACGRTPLPPYVKREATAGDRERYQTVYARNAGSVAAPTAGLHFTDGLLQALRGRGIGMSYLTLHVGLGTFQPVKEPDPRNHHIHSELYSLSGQTVEEILRTRSQGGRTVAVGTTAARVLEHCSRHGKLEPSSGSCDLFILPGFGFHAVDALLTNFHLPRSTLLMLVAAFAGLDRVLAAYRQAVAERYRFYSYGDAMLVE